MSSSSNIKHLISSGAFLYRTDKKTKKIQAKSWGDTSHTVAELTKHVDSGGVISLIPASLGLVVIDLDTGDAIEWYKQWRNKLGEDGKPLLAVKSNQPNRAHLYYRCPPVTNRFKLRHTSGSFLADHHGDIRGSKGYIVLWGDTLTRLSNVLSDDVRELEGWVPLQFMDMLYRDEAAKEAWQMTGDRNNALNREAYLAACSGDEESIRKATRKAIIQGLPLDEISATVAHATEDGTEIEQLDVLPTQTKHRGARLAELYHQVTPNIVNYREKGSGADYTGLVYLEWSNALGWTQLDGTEIVSGLRICNNSGKPSMAREAMLDLASLKHYGNLKEWNSAGKKFATDKDRYLGLPDCNALDVTTGQIVSQQKDWRILRCLNVDKSKELDPVPVRWLECLDTWTDSNVEVIDFLQLLCGYILYGGNPEHKFIFLYGEGSNGKSTFIDCIMSIFGTDYSCVMSRAIYEEKEKEHATVIKALQHKRMLVSGEIKPMRSWNVSMIKDITGGNTIYARKMYGDPEPIKVTGMPIFQGNHLPIFVDTTIGWGRRVIIVPFNVTIPEEKRIPELVTELEKEAPEIFMWMVEGLRKYLQTRKLSLPEIIEQGTEDYLTDYSETNVLSEEHLVDSIKNYLAELKEASKTSFLIEDLIDFCGLDVDASYKRTRYYKMIKNYMLQSGWESIRMTDGGQRKRGYAKQ